MKKIMLNIGCGKKKLPGFINIDIDKDADLVLDVTRGLSYGNNSVHAVFSEHFIEHITQAEGVAFLRECRRVLVNHGRLRIATPDLDYIVGVYQSVDWRTKNPEWARYGYDWVDSRAEQMNLAMREWGHQWMYDEEELVRLALIAGLTPVGRQRFCESELPEFRGLEYREGSRLIYEFVKDRPCVKDDEPLVSILIPAYSYRYLKECLESAIAQTYQNTEIIISDDNPDSDDNKRIVETYANSDSRVRYYRNPRNLGDGGRGNLLRCFELSKGEYIKFLNDDDLLYPDCVRRMVYYLNRFPDVMLVTSHRQCIGSDGNCLADIAATNRLVQKDSIIDGVFLAGKMLETRMNFIGEPTTVMFRRRDLSDSKPSIISFAGRECIANGDMTMWLNLLSKGDALYLTDTLSCFRLHEGQGQRTTAFRQRALKGLEQLVFDGKRMGLMISPAIARELIRTTDETEQVLSEPAESEIQRIAPKVSIIIPVFNKAEFTQKCIEAVLKNTPGWLYECILVDNGSTDSTWELLSSFGDDVKVISNAENLGFAKACNQGAKAAKGRYLLFLNNDTEPQEGWLEPLIDILEADDSVAAAGSKLLYPDGTIQHAGVMIVEDRKNMIPLNPQHIYHHKPDHFDDVDQMKTYQALTAACLLIRKAAFEEVHGFDEEFWNGYEDMDLCFKLREKGWKLIYQPGSVVIHYESKSGPERFVKAQDNIARLYEKWLGRIKPDFIIDQDGTLTMTDVREICPYYAPEPITQPLTAKAMTIKASLVSIVILTFNQLEYTKKCIKSIRKHTPEDHEIIFVDNGSTDGTVKWLKKLVIENKNYRLVENSENLGFAKGCNQGIEASAGEFILLLNNDVIVTEGWLSGMLECLNSASDIGIVGPLTNNISGPQQVTSSEYRSVDYLDEYAAKFRERNRHRRIPLQRIVGFCMLFRRSLADKVGLLDESFGTGNFEDDDYCLRASIEGYRNTLAGDVFIHHYGSRSFIGNRIDYGSAMAGNRRVFNEKWRGINRGTELGKKVLISIALENADEFSQKGETDKAVERLIEAIKHAPESTEIYLAMSAILLESKRYQDALDVLNSMPEKSKEDTKTLILTGYCKEGLELQEEAGEYADRVLSKEPAHASALNLKGMLEYKRNDRKAAEDYFKKAIESDPGYGEPYTNLGVLKWAEGDKEVGLAMFEKGFILSPKVMDIATMYHSAISEMQDFERAEKAFQEAEKLYLVNRRIVFLHIDVLLQQGRFEAAMQEIEKAIITFGIDDGLLAAALEVRGRVGTKKIDRAMKKDTLSLCMIVKNEEQHIAKCLMSADPAVNEMIVVDTGSADRTKDIAKALGAKVFDFEWTGDFSDARNYSLSKASGEWIFVLDADEVISPADYNLLANTVKKSKPAAYTFVTRNYSNQTGAQGWTANDGKYQKEEAAIGWFPSTKARLFPNDKRIRFENPVHEFVEGTVRKAGMPVKTCDIPIHHYGRLDMEKVAVKGEEYYQLGRKKLEEKGTNDQKALFELGVQAGELKKYSEAAGLFEKLIELDPKYPLALFNLGFAYMELGRYDEALVLTKKAFELDPEKKEVAINYAHCELVAGDIGKSMTILEETLRKEPEYPPAMAALASAYYIEGRKEEGLRIIEGLKKKQFDCSNFLYDIAKGFFQKGRIRQAMVLIEAAVQTKSIHADTKDLLDKCYRKLSDNQQD